MIHDLDAEFNSASESCIIGPREVHSETVSVHFWIYVGSGVYGHDEPPAFQKYQAAWQLLS